MRPSIFYITLLCFCGGTLVAQQHKVVGVVTDAFHNPVPFCVVKVLHADVSTYCNEYGGFTIAAHPGDKLLFHCVGFEDQTVVAQNDSVVVRLNVQTVNMDDVAITAKKGKGYKNRIGTLGKKRLKPYSIFTGEIGTETAIFLKADSSKNGYIMEVCFYILKEGIPDSRFRVHVYDIDTYYLPGKDLTDSNVIVHGNAGNEWVKVDLSARSIPVGRGVFVSMEWIEGYNNSKKYYSSPKYFQQPPFQGQVLASTEGYSRQQSLLYIKRSLHAEWKFQAIPTFRKSNFMNPMVYATYRY